MTCKNLNELTSKLGYNFKNIELLQQALSHKSSGRNNYERLEFVGDSILDYAIAYYLYCNHPNYSEGELSQIRASLVNQDTLSEIAKSINLGDFLFLGDGEEKSLGRNRPSILADSLEALFAAISLDSNLTQATKVITNLYKNKFENIIHIIKKDSKSLLQEYLQSKKIKLPEYNIIQVTGPDHDSLFEVECKISELNIIRRAKGKTKKEASQIVAKEILSLLISSKS